MVNHRIPFFTPFAFADVNRDSSSPSSYCPQNGISYSFHAFGTPEKKAKNV